MGKDNKRIIMDQRIPFYRKVIIVFEWFLASLIPLCLIGYIIYVLGQQYIDNSNEKLQIKMDEMHKEAEAKVKIDAETKRIEEERIGKNEFK